MNTPPPLPTGLRRILAATCTLVAAQTTFYAAGFDTLTHMREANRSPWVIAKLR